MASRIDFNLPLRSQAQQKQKLEQEISDVDKELLRLNKLIQLSTPALEGLKRKQQADELLSAQVTKAYVS